MPINQNTYMNQMPREMEDAIERGYFVNERIYE